MPELLDKRLIFVTGKGGVGKSTIAVSLGLAAADQGKRTIVCEIASQEQTSRFFKRGEVGFHEVEQRRARSQRAQLARLEEMVSTPVKTLPFIFEPELGVEDARKLARCLA